MRQFVLSCAFALCGMAAFGQGYQFTEVARVPATPVKNQASTGTCWCFATTSFMESELLRMGKGTYDLSEMFIASCKTTTCARAGATSRKVASRTLS